MELATKALGIQYIRVLPLPAVYFMLFIKYNRIMKMFTPLQHLNSQIGGPRSSLERRREIVLVDFNIRHNMMVVRCKLEWP